MYNQPYTCIINLIHVTVFCKPVNFIALKLCVLAMELRIHFDFSLVYILWAEKCPFSPALQC